MRIHLNKNEVAGLRIKDQEKAIADPGKKTFQTIVSFMPLYESREY